MNSPLWGLVLAGGRSTRMGKDKSLILHKGKPMYQLTVAKLKKSGLPVLISCRTDQIDQFAGFSVIADTVPPKGPISGLLSAFDTHKNYAWLLLPVDMPLITSEFIVKTLIKNRNRKKQATVLQLQGQNFKQPLPAIYEPASFSIVKTQFSNKNYSLKKILDMLDVEIVVIEGEEHLLANFNFPEDWIDDHSESQA